MKMLPHQEAHADGGTSGRDPRKMSADDLIALGLERTPRGDAIRAKCLDCCNGAPSEVRRCGAIDCALWPFRMGSDPWRAPMSDERREAAAERLGRTRAARAAEPAQPKRISLFD